MQTAIKIKYCTSPRRLKSQFNARKAQFLVGDSTLYSVEGIHRLHRYFAWYWEMVTSLRNEIRQRCYI